MSSRHERPASHLTSAEQPHCAQTATEHIMQSMNNLAIDNRQAAASAPAAEPHSLHQIQQQHAAHECISAHSNGHFDAQIQPEQPEPVDPQSVAFPQNHSSAETTNDSKNYLQNDPHQFNQQQQQQSDASCSSTSPIHISRTTKRNCNTMKMFFLDHYFDLLSYIGQRKQRLEEFRSSIAQSSVSDEVLVDQWTSYCERESALLRKRRTRMRMSNFQILKQIGQGGYGQVYLARKKDTQEICALKRMNKRLLQRMGEIQHVLTERDILARTDSPWLVKLLYAFQDYESIYLAMEYVPGGDFRSLLNASGVLREQHARLYFSEMCASVFALHSYGYIHRDLKPENFLIDVTGHIKLTDFGLSRGALSPQVMESLRAKLDKLKDAPLTLQTTAQRYNTYRSIRKELRAFTLVGSPDYMAPEVLVASAKGYDHSVDYWSLGCILFECLSGYPPFTAKTTDDVWLNVYHWQRVLERPVYVGQDEEFNIPDLAWDLVIRLITSAEDRYQTPQQIQSHPFIANHLDFSTFRTPAGPTAPLVPVLACPTDTSYFDDFDNPEDMARYKEVHQRHNDLNKVVADGTGNGKDANPEQARGLRSAFVGFTFKHHADYDINLDMLM